MVRGFIAGAAALIACAGVSTADAAVTVIFSEVGNNVSAIASGTLDITALRRDGNYPLSSYVWGSRAAVTFGSEPEITAYTGLTGYPADFGIGGRKLASTSTGSTFGLSNSTGGGTIASVDVARDFISGGAISSTDLWIDRRIASLGLTVEAIPLPCLTIR